jgi:hypothetical protein
MKSTTNNTQKNSKGNMKSKRMSKQSPGTPKEKDNQKLEPATITSQTAFLVLLATIGEREKLKSRQEALAFTRGFACAWASFTTPDEGKQVLSRLRRVFVNVNQPRSRRNTAVRGSAKT